MLPKLLNKCKKICCCEEDEEENYNNRNKKYVKIPKTSKK